MKYQLVKDKLDASCWRVEAINHRGEGECHVALFMGPQAETAAREYAAWKNG